MDSVRSAQTDRQDGPVRQTGQDDRRLADAYQAWIDAFGSEPTRAQFARWLQDRYGIATAAGGPLSDEQLVPFLQVIRQRHFQGADVGAEGEPESADEGWGDYFYNAWLMYAQQHGTYPGADALATHVYECDQITSADGRPLTGGDLEAFVRYFQQREFDEAEPPAGPLSCRLVSNQSRRLCPSRATMRRRRLSLARKHPRTHAGPG